MQRFMDMVSPCLWALLALSFLWLKSCLCTTCFASSLLMRLQGWGAGGGEWGAVYKSRPEQERRYQYEKGTAGVAAPTGTESSQATSLCKAGPRSPWNISGGSWGSKGGMPKWL